MNGIKGILLSIRRNYLRSISMFLIFTVVFTVLTGSFLIRDAASKTISIFESSARLSLNVDGQFSNINNLADYETVNGDFLKETDRILSLLDELKQDKRCVNIEYNLTKRLTKGNVGTRDYTSDENTPRFIPEVMKAIMDGTADEFFKDPQNKDITDRYFSVNNLNDNLVISGVHSMSLDDLTNRYIRLLLKSRQDPSTKTFFTESNLENGDFVCIVNNMTSAYDKSKDDSSAPEKRINNIMNDPTRNKTVYFTDFYVRDGQVVYTKTYEFKVVGYCTSTGKSRNDVFIRDNLGHVTENNRYIYIPEKTLLNIQAEQQELMEKYDCNVFTSEFNNSTVFINRKDLITGFSVFSKPMFVSSITVDVEKEEDLVSLTEYIRDYCRDFKSIKVTNSSEDLDRIAAPVKALSDVSIIVLIACIALSVAVLLLLVILQVRDRNQEIGILMALGQKKTVICKNIVSEILLLGTAALFAAMFIGNYYGAKVSDYVIRKFTFRTISSKFYSLTTNQVISKFHIALSFPAGIRIFLISYAVMIFSVIAAVTIITRVNPRKVLLSDR